MDFKNKKQRTTHITNLRGHHLACICNFVGRGYSSKFISNMTRVKNFLNKNPKLNCIKIVSGFDDLCSSCPNKLNSCSSSDSAERDLAFLKLFNFRVNSFVSFEQVLSKMGALISDKTFADLCNGCSWFSLCNSIRRNSGLLRLNKQTE